MKKIAALKERAKGENRAALTPDVVKLLSKDGYKIFVEKGIGNKANFTDQNYIDAGAQVSSVPLEIISDADIIVKVQPSPLTDQINEITLAKNGSIIVGLLSPYNNAEYIKRSLTKRLTTIAMELVPRITRAQNIDVLSSQSNLAGYRAVIEAAYIFTRAIPMMMTAAGTISPAKTLILGAGVAGLQAIATAKRLGSAVSAYDVRAATKEQVESLGAKFVYPTEEHGHVDSADAEDKTGYAKELGKDFEKIQHKFLDAIIANYDIVITTAQIPGQKAPMLISDNMIKKMKHGSIIVDMATGSGGNVSGSKDEQIIETAGGVQIIGYSNMASRIASDSSKLYAKNIYNLLKIAISHNKLNIEDQIVKEMIVGMDGRIFNKKFEI